MPPEHEYEGHFFRRGSENRSITEFSSRAAGFHWKQRGLPEEPVAKREAIFKQVFWNYDLYKKKNQIRAVVIPITPD
jgi:hypothetical protein